MSLSEFRVHLLNCDGEALECVQIKFIKEFIKKLKERFNKATDYSEHIPMLHPEDVTEIIDELVGPELTE